MPRRTLLIFSLLSAALLIGCYKSETTNNSNSMATNSNKTASNSSTSSTSTSTSKSTAGAEKIGVPECDDFITKYDACVSGKVPDAQRSQYETMLKQWRDTWRQLAANPMTKGTLAAACKQAAEQARTSMKSYNCNF